MHIHCFWFIELAGSWGNKDKQKQKPERVIMSSKNSEKYEKLVQHDDHDLSSNENNQQRVKNDETQPTPFVNNCNSGVHELEGISNVNNQNEAHLSQIEGQPDSIALPEVQIQQAPQAQQALSHIQVESLSSIAIDNRYIRARFINCLTGNEQVDRLLFIDLLCNGVCKCVPNIYSAMRILVRGSVVLTIIYAILYMFGAFDTYYIGLILLYIFGSINGIISLKKYNKISSGLFHCYCILMLFAHIVITTYNIIHYKKGKVNNSININFWWVCLI